MTPAAPVTPAGASATAAPAGAPGEPSGFFVLRTPLLPFAVLSGWSAGLEAPGRLGDPAALDEALAADRMRLRRRLEDIVTEAAFREGIFVASPSLARAIDTWRKDPDGERGRRAEQSLVSYLMRAATRPTPFGLFAGCTTGTIGAQTVLRLRGQDKYLRHTRLDMDYLWALSDAIERDPALRAGLRFTPNSSLRDAGDRLLFAESYQGPNGRCYRLVALAKTPYLLDTIALASAGNGTGARLDELAAPLTCEDVSTAEAQEYLGELVDSQVLVADARPQLTGLPPSQAMVATLASHPATADVSRRLHQARDALAAIDASGLGVAPERYQAVAGLLASLPAAPDLSRFVQVDMTKPAERAELGSEVVAELRRGAALLHAFARHRPDQALEQFREQFTRRYETRELPLASVLDEESGIGFGMSGAESAEAAPLLAGLPLRRQRELSGDWTPRDSFLHEKLARALTAGSPEIAITAPDAEVVAGDSAPPLPGACEVLATVVAESERAIALGDFKVMLHSVSGPSGVRLLGRFCHADGELDELVRAHLRAEEAQRPDCVFAEIVHQPEGRIGNILSRPVLRAYEIPYLGRSGAPADRQLPLSDLLVTVQGDRIVLRSARLRREVIPRLTTAHNYSFGGLGVYRFLGALQNQDSSPGVRWDWGPLRDAPFLPRVVAGRAILSRATWNLREPELAAFRRPRGSAMFASVQELRIRARLPRYVALADADNELAADLDNVLSVEALAHQIGRRQLASLVELIPGPGQLCVTGPQGAFTHQVIVPFARAASPPAPTGGLDGAAGGLAVAERAVAARRFPPGSQWLYLKLYTGPATADLVLSQVAPVLSALADAGITDRWHFIRYQDPDWHVRLRLHGAPEALLGQALPALHAAMAALLGTGQVWRVQLDTYEREVERYGGPRAVELAEQVFHADSDAVLAVLRQLPGDVGADLRWRVALTGIDRLFDDLGMTGAQKRATARLARHGYEREFGTDGAFQKAVGGRFRDQRQYLEAVLDLALPTPPELAPSLRALARRSAALGSVTPEITAMADSGALRVRVTDLALSFAHLHVNRLLRSAQRAQELVLYEILDRHYSSLAGRGAR